MAADNLSNNADVSSAKNSDEILDLLNVEDDNDESDKDDKIKDKSDKGKEKEEIKDEEDEDDKSEDKDSKEDDEIEIVEDEIEVDEDIDVIVPVSKKVILAKYPKLFKDFPQLEASYYKAQQYAEIIPTLDDARELVEKGKSLDKFEADILDGNLETLFSTIKEHAPKSLKKIADNLITTLSKVDESSALHVIGNIFRHSLVKAEMEGKRSKNSDLEAAAKIINEFIFGDEEIKPPSRLTTEKSDDEDEGLKKEREEFEAEKFNSALGTLQTKVDNTLKATIDANIDPKSSMSSYVKKHAVSDAFEQVEKALTNDASFKRILDNLWRAAKDAKYSSPSLDKIRSAYLSKAKTMLPSAIRSARAEALKGIGRQNTESSSESKKGPLPANRSSSSSSSTGSKIKEIPKGMSTKDFIMQD